MLHHGASSFTAPRNLRALIDRSYLFEVAGLPDQQLHTILTDITPRSAHKMITAAEHIRRRTRREVMPKFMARGQVRLVLLLLEEKFGSLPPRLVARIRRARTETLEGWFARALKASVLDEVFAES